MPPENFFPPIGLDEGVFSRQEAENLLKFRSFQQQPVIYVAANDTPDTLRYMAKYKCDGVADDDELQAAFNEASGGGGEVVLLEGTYLMDEVAYVGTDTRVRGVGKAVLKLTANAGADAGCIATQAASRLTIENLTFGPHANADPDYHVNIVGGTDIRLSRLTMTEFADVGIKVESGERVTIEDCEISSCQNGIYLSEIDGTNASIRVKITGCYIYGQTSDGVVISSYQNTISSCTFIGQGSNDIKVDGDRNVIANNVFSDAGIDAIDIASGASGNTISGNTITLAGGGYESLIDCAGTDNVIVGNTLSGGGIRVTANNNVINDNRLFSNCVGIQIDADRNTVVGNSIDDCRAGASHPGHGITITGDYCTIQSNNISFADEDGIQCDGGNYNNIVGNYIYNAGERGIHLLGVCDSTTVDSNYVYNASADSTGTYDAIFVADVSGMNHNSIKNNVVKGSVNHRYGIRLDGTNVNNTLVSNNELVFSGATGAYSDAGTGTDTLGGNRT